MPVWMNPDGSEKLVVASREEIFELNKPYGQLTKLIITRHGESVEVVFLEPQRAITPGQVCALYE